MRLVPLWRLIALSNGVWLLTFEYYYLHFSLKQNYQQTMLQTCFVNNLLTYHLVVIS